jgi:hypothetical protein
MSLEKNNHQLSTVSEHPLVVRSKREIQRFAQSVEKNIKPILLGVATAAALSMPSALAGSTTPNQTPTTQTLEQSTEKNNEFHLEMNGVKVNVATSGESIKITSEDTDEGSENFIKRTLSDTFIHYADIYPQVAFEKGKLTLVITFEDMKKMLFLVENAKKTISNNPKLNSFQREEWLKRLTYDTQNNVELKSLLEIFRKISDKK